MTVKADAEMMPPSIFGMYPELPLWFQNKFGMEMKNFFVQGVIILLNSPAQRPVELESWNVLTQ